MLIPNTFHIKAHCRTWIEYHSAEEALQLLPPIAKEPKWVHVGAGSNLVPLGDYDGIVVHSCIRGLEVLKEQGDEVLVRVGSGETWDEVVARLIQHDLYGAENLSLIPGETGAAAVQNIGAYGAEIADVIERVEALHIPSGTLRTFAKAECRYGYRTSRFKHGEEAGQYAVLYVVLRLSRTFRPSLEYGGLKKAVAEAGLTEASLTADALRAIIVATRQAKLPDPTEIGSAGSFFMNPVVPTVEVERLLEQYPSMPHYPAPDPTCTKLSAGWLIEACGWKGKALGNAAVYAKQALILINPEGKATGEDVLRLAQQIQHDVKTRFGIQLTPEAQFLK